MGKELDTRANQQTQLQFAGAEQAWEAEASTVILKMVPNGCSSCKKNHCSASRNWPQMLRIRYSSGHRGDTRDRLADCRSAQETHGARNSQPPFVGGHCP